MDLLSNFLSFLNPQSVQQQVSGIMELPTQVFHLGLQFAGNGIHTIKEFAGSALAILYIQTTGIREHITALLNFANQLGGFLPKR